MIFIHFTMYFASLHMQNGGNKKFDLEILKKITFSPGSWLDPGLKSYFGAPVGCQAKKNLLSRVVAWPGTKG